MKDYRTHMLKSSNEIRELKEMYGEKFIKLQKAGHAYLKGIPCDIWIDYTKKTTEKNLPVFIKIICDYIDHNSTVFDFVEFNSTFTMIRRKEKQKIYHYYKYETKKKTQDNCSMCE